MKPGAKIIRTIEAKEPPQSPFDVIHSTMVIEVMEPYVAVSSPECICGTCDMLDCTGHCCVNSPLFRADGKPGDGPECWHCEHGDPKGGRQ